MKLDTYTATGTKSKTPLTVSKDVFGSEVKPHVMSQAIRVYLSNQRQGTSKVKTRGEVARTKKKWFKQKGTGNARHGARSANLFVGGGVSHGPTGLENWKKSLPTRFKHQALAAALTAQVAQIMVCDGVDKLSGKTKEAAQLLTKLGTQDEKVLVVVPSFATESSRAFRNLENVLLTKASRLNVYEVALADKIIFTKEAVEQLEARLSKYIKK